MKPMKENKLGITKVIDFMSDAFGSIGAWLIFALILLLTFEVIMRNVFASPTAWSYDIAYMVGGSAAALSLARGLKEGSHVRVDLIYCRFKPKTKAIFNILMSLIFFYPIMFFGTLGIVKVAIKSVSILEQIQLGIVILPIYPLKTVLAIGMVLFLLQAVAELIRDIRTLMAKGDISYDC